VNVSVGDVSTERHGQSCTGVSEQEIVLHSIVRNRLAYQLPLSNPLKHTRASISSFSCESAHIDIPHLPLDLPPDSQKRLTLYYRPLCRESNAQSVLTLRSQELGSYKFLLKLSSTPVGIDKVLKFNSFLGGQDLQTFRFVHFASSSSGSSEDKAKETLYELSITRQDKGKDDCEHDFSVAQTQMKVQSNGEESVAVAVDVTYLPSNVGRVRNLLVVRSPDNNSTYQCALHGFCDPPKPKGPYQVSTSKASLQIAFQNPFRESCHFAFSTDRSCFALKKREEVIKSKAKVMIDVSFKPDSAAKDKDKDKDKKAIMGKLIIKSKQQHEWVYYIRGLIQ